MQDLFGVTTLEKQTQGEDIYASLISMMKSRNIEIKSTMSLTTDEATAMLARGKGLAGQLVKDNPDLITTALSTKQCCVPAWEINIVMS